MVMNGTKLVTYEPRHEKTCFLAFVITKFQISCTEIVQLISAFVLATHLIIDSTSLPNYEISSL